MSQYQTKKIFNILTDRFRSSGKNTSDLKWAGSLLCHLKPFKARFNHDIFTHSLNWKVHVLAIKTLLSKVKTTSVSRSPTVTCAAKVVVSRNQYNIEMLLQQGTNRKWLACLYSSNCDNLGCFWRSFFYCKPFQIECFVYKLARFRPIVRSLCCSRTSCIMNSEYLLRPVDNNYLTKRFIVFAMLPVLNDFVFDMYSSSSLLHFCGHKTELCMIIA